MDNSILKSKISVYGIIKNNLNKHVYSSNNFESDAIRDIIYNEKKSKD